jgi:hypothetical protein
MARKSTPQAMAGVPHANAADGISKAFAIASRLEVSPTGWAYAAATSKAERLGIERNVHACLRGK